MKKLIQSVLASALTLGALPVFAANDGTLGATSQGDFVISLAVPDLIRISSLNDQPLAYTPGSGATVTENFCVYTNAAAGTYNVTATSTGDANNGNTGVFLLQNAGNTATMAYTISYDTVAPAEGVNNNNGAAGFTANTTAVDCEGTEPTSVVVSVAQSVIDSAAPDTYTDTLTFLVSPN